MPAKLAMMSNQIRNHASVAAKTLGGTGGGKGLSFHRADREREIGGRNR